MTNPTPQYFESSKYPFSSLKLAGQSKKLAAFSLGSKFHVLVLHQIFDCRNAGKIRKLNCQAVTLGIQRQSRVA